jgi:hypothetical protein
VSASFKEIFNKRYIFKRNTYIGGNPKITNSNPSGALTREPKKNQKNYPQHRWNDMHKLRPHYRESPVKSRGRNPSHRELGG